MVVSVGRFHAEEVADHLAAAFGEDAFRMELDAFDGQGAMAQAHDDGLAVFASGTGGDFELIRQAFFADDERVIARASEGRRQAGEDALAVVFDGTGFAVHELGGADDLATEGCSDGLMAEADAEDGNFAGHALDQRDENACVLRRARAGRKQDAIWIESLDLVDGKLIVAANQNVVAVVAAEFAEVLDEVVGEGIVVVEDEDHG